MVTIWAKTALLPQGWAEDVAVEVGKDGQIENVATGVPATGHPIGILLPAPANSHSHAFQRAMAGLTEQRGPDPKDNFWTWRRLMYRFLDRITPDQVEAISALVQMEMLEAGFATNVEFHYLHHGPDGAPYDNLGEMAERVGAASVTSGIGLTLLPVLYQFAGCDGRELGPGQRRFGNDWGRFEKLVDVSREVIEGLDNDANIGVAPHSLRAVAPQDLRRVDELAKSGPIHMHIAEQLAEVEEVKTAWGARPVEWALDNLCIDDRWCLIHCTQMQSHETQALAASGAIAGLCPLTEASLGDGIFDGVNWMNARGKISIGSDSNILISLSEEMRQLDTSQRLRDHSRATLATTTKSTGRSIFDAICAGGAKAAGRKCGAIEVGNWADLLALDGGHANLTGLSGDTILDAFAFTDSRNMVCDVWSAGRHIVQYGTHVRRQKIVETYLKSVTQLREAT